MSEDIWILLVKKITKEASSAEIRELAVYFEKHPEAKRMEAELLSFWNTPVGEQPDTQKLFSNHLKRLKAMDAGFVLNEEWMEEPAGEKIKQGGTPLPLRKFLSIAAVLILISATVLWALSNLFSKNAENNKAAKTILNEIQTKNGSRSKVVLPDGSEVWVNASSRLVYKPDFGKSHRKVQLNGEAYFRVVKNKSIPFEIETKRITITVTGTTFNVRDYDDEEKVETALFEGSVQVKQNTSPEKSYILKPNQKLIFDKSEDDYSTKQQTSSQNDALGYIKPNMLTIPAIKDITYDLRDSMVLETSWLYNTLAFRDESFLELANKMEKWYGIEITFESKRLENIRFTGRFTTETIQEALEALQFTADFQFKKDQNSITIY